MQDTDTKLNSVKDFVSKHRVRAKKGIVCVDGRYPAGSEYSGMLARPGGNFRGIMTLLSLRKKLGLTVGQVVDKAVDAVERMGIDFNMHTDSHANPEDLTSIGCGHIARAADPKTAKMYGVDPDDVKHALIYLRLKLEDKKYYNMQQLKGSHAEKGVLVITGTKYTVDHFDPKTEEMYFVFDRERDKEYSKKLYDHLKVKNLKFEDFYSISSKQLDATLENLAAGLPVYEVNVDAKEPEVKLVGHVKKLS